jgi:hypothetical protein
MSVLIYLVLLLVVYNWVVVVVYRTIDVGSPSGIPSCIPVGSRGFPLRVVLAAGLYPRYMQLYTPDIVCRVDTVSSITLIDH